MKCLVVTIRGRSIVLIFCMECDESWIVYVSASGIILANQATTGQVVIIMKDSLLNEVWGFKLASSNMIIHTQKWKVEKSIVHFFLSSTIVFHNCRDNQFRFLWSLSSKKFSHPRWGNRNLFIWKSPTADFVHPSSPTSVSNLLSLDWSVPVTRRSFT